MQNRKVIIVGAIPPPITGSSIITHRFRDFLESKNINNSLINTSPKEISLKKISIGRLSRLIVFFKTIRALITKIYTYKNIKPLVYIPVSGSYGLLFDIIYIFIARIHKLEIIAHHHSYAYINSKSYLMQVFLALLGSKNKNIVLSKDMKLKIEERYGMYKFYDVSNSLFIKNQDFKLRKEATINVGFISNITKAKGINEFFEVVDELSKKDNSNYIFHLAGPSLEIDITKKINMYTKNLKNFNYYGLVDEINKDMFYRKIDILLFPTKYFNEAEPLVILEAQSYGIVPISNDRGSIKYILPNDDFYIASDENYFVREAIIKIHSCLDPSVYDKYSKQSYDNFYKLKDENKQKLNKLI